MTEDRIRWAVDLHADEDGPETTAAKIREWFPEDHERAGAALDYLEVEYGQEVSV